MIDHLRESSSDCLLKANNFLSVGSGSVTWFGWNCFINKSSLIILVQSQLHLKDAINSVKRNYFSEDRKICKEIGQFCRRHWKLSFLSNRTLHTLALLILPDNWLLSVNGGGSCVCESFFGCLRKHFFTRSQPTEM